MVENGNETIVLTGATGFLGSHLMSAFLERGYNVFVLGRPHNGMRLADRIMRHLAWFGIDRTDFYPHIVEADLLKPHLGLESHMYREICRTQPVIVHCASETTFSTRDSKASIDANVGTVQGIISLARDCHSPFLHHISTAYVTEPDQPVSYEAPVTRPDFANIYEETKAVGERVLVTECSRLGVPYTIIRPSIVYGNSETGRANYFNALYYHVRALKIIRDMYRKDIDEYGGRRRSRNTTIFLNPDGSLRLPLRIFLPRKGHLNLIPVNFFTRLTLAVMEHPQHGAIYHVTNDIHKSIEHIADYCEKFLKIKGLQVIYGNPADDELNPPEEIFNRLSHPYFPYLSDTRIFDRSNTRMTAPGVSAPEMTYDIFSRCMEYAVRTSWGHIGASRDFPSAI